MKKSIRIFWIIFLTGFSFVVLFFLMVLFGVFGKLPSTSKLENPSILQASEVYGADGTLMGKYFTERGNRSNVNYRDISKNVIDALVATEDVRFHDHSGIDFKRTFSAVLSLGNKGGGSTITQQLAKTLLFDRASKNKALRVIEKMKEYIVAVRLERNFTKEEIISLYLNAVPYGENIYGIRNASKTFFQKEPDRLTKDEAALLVGVLAGNSIYNPRNHPKASKNRRNVVLSQMEKNGYLASADAERLKAMPINLNYKRIDENNGIAPYFRDQVLKKEIDEVLKNETKADGEAYDIYDDGLKIYTTINPKMQQYAEEAQAQQMPILQKALNSQSNIKKGTVWKGHENVLNAAMKNSDRWKNLKDDGLSDVEIKKAFTQKVKMRVFAWNAKRQKDTIMTPLDSIKYHRQMVQSSFIVTDPITGEVRAWVGGIDFKTYKLDHAQLTKRQVGSSIKPLLYCQAIEERGLTPESMVEDVQQSFGKNQLVPITTKSCTGRTMTMASALAWSRNCATAYIMKQVGAPQFANFLEQKLNIPTKVDPYPSIALGACELSLYEMMWGYSVFPGHGFSTKPSFISRIEDRNGNVIKRIDIGANRKEAISEITAYQMVKMMEGPVTVGSARGLMQALGAKEMSGKTGTTNDNADFWFMGFTPQLLAGTWVGCDDRFIQIESGAYMGGTAARPIWEAFFKKVYADKSLGIDRDAAFLKPADLENESNSADSFWYNDGSGLEEGQDNGVNEGDYSIDTSSYIPPDSQSPANDNPPKKDTSKMPKIGEMKTPDDKKDNKNNIFKKIFGKKDKPENDY